MKTKEKHCSEGKRWSVQPYIVLPWFEKTVRCSLFDIPKGKRTCVLTRLRNSVGLQASIAAELTSNAHLIVELTAHLETRLKFSQARGVGVLWTDRVN